MKSPLVLALAGLVVFGCKEKVSDSRSTVAAATPTAAPPAPVTLTPSTEIIGSAVRVRVMADGRPAKNYAGALLRRDEIKDARAYFEMNRCVLAFLPGWTDAQLRERRTTIFVFRNLPTPSGQGQGTVYAARLADFDAQSGIAAITYAQGISASLDVGLAINREPVKEGAAWALRFVAPLGFTEPALPGLRGPDFLRHGFASRLNPLPNGLPPYQPGLPSGAPTPEPQPGPPLPLDTGSLALAGDGAAKFPAVEPGAVADETALVATAPALLEGFVSANAGAALVSLQSYIPKISVKELEAANAVFGRERFAGRPPGSGPMNSGQTPGGNAATADGGAGPSQKVAVAETKVPSVSFTLESPAKGVFEIAGGREILLQLTGAPFWKRFSMEKEDWLPLPEGNLASADVAGNLSSLYLLDHEAAEVRRYRLSDLTLIKSVKLNNWGDLFSPIRAGCNTDRTPVHFAGPRGLISLDPESLARLDDAVGRVGYPRMMIPKMRYRAAGDGLSLFSDGGFGDEYSYVADGIGLEPGGFDASNMTTEGISVTGAFRIDYDLKTCANPQGAWVATPGPPRTGEISRKILFPNTPVLGQLVVGNERTSPPTPPRLECYGFSDTVPFTQVVSPKIPSPAGRIDLDRNAKSRVCFDPNSRRFGILEPDQTTWVVMDLPSPADPPRPALLNWPETYLSRGGEFHFKPLLFGPGKITAELLGAKESTPVTVDDDGSVSFHLSPNELATLLLLKLTTTGAQGNATYPIPIRVRGLPLPYICLDSNPYAHPARFGADFQSLSRSKADCIAPNTTLYESPAGLMEAYGPINGYLALLTDAHRIDFLSVETKKVTNSIPLPENVNYYPGGGALFEYSTATHALTRISVPDGKRGASFNLPPNSALHAVAIGSRPEQPLTLFLERRQDFQSGRLGDVEVKSWHFDHAIIPVNSETLRAGPWKDPEFWSDNPDQPTLNSAFANFPPGDPFPVRVVGSREGVVLVLNDHLVVLSPHYSIVAPYPFQGHNFASIYHTAHAAGSITGLIASDGDGQIFKNGQAIPAAPVSNDNWLSGVTPCGRYRLIGPYGDGEEINKYLAIHTVEGNTPLFRLNRLIPLQRDGSSVPMASQQRIRLLQDNGPLLVLSPGGRLLQFIDFDIPRLARELQPETFHVTSQPQPILVAPGTYEYQVEVNNPSAVNGYKLDNAPAGATISPTGLLRYVCSQSVNKPTQVNFSILITGKGDQTVLHFIPLIVLPRTIPPLPTPNRPKAGPGVTVS